MSDTLSHCIYASAATRLLNTGELLYLLERAQRRNVQWGITGVLLHAQGSYFQVIEGPQAAVETLYAQIAQDPRHEQVTLIIHEPIQRRTFKNWSMGLLDVSPLELAGMTGVNDFFDDRRGFTGLDSGRAMKLLNSFRDGRWHKKAVTVHCEVD